jgi:ribonuclease HI
MQNLICYCDGGFNNLTKTGGYGSFRVYDSESDITVRLKFDSIKSSNEAEYQTLISMLEYVLEHYPEYSLDIYSDSKLMCNQLNSIWEIHSISLTPFFQTAVVLLNEVQDWKLTWVPRANLVRELGH